MSGINLETEEKMINEMSSQWGVMLKGTGLDRNVIVRRLHDSSSIGLVLNFTTNGEYACTWRLV